MEAPYREFYARSGEITCMLEIAHEKKSRPVEG